MTDNLDQNWNTYLSAFHATDEAERGQLLEQCVSEDVIFTNPGGNGKTRAGLNAHIGKFHQMMPGAYFSTDKVFIHHGELLAVWIMHEKDGTKAQTGYNFVRPGQDGRFSYMAGFF